MIMLFSPRLWPWLAVLASAAMLAAAHAFERYGGLAPCVLCLRQREVYWLAMTFALALGLGLVIVERLGGRWPAWPIARWGLAGLAAIFLYGAYLAAFHAGVEWHFWPGPAACASTATAGSGLDARAVLEALASAQKAPSCDTAPWRLAGISMAGYNALISLGLAFASAFAALPRKAAP